MQKLRPILSAIIGAAVGAGIVITLRLVLMTNAEPPVQPQQRTQLPPQTSPGPGTPSPDTSAHAPATQPAEPNANTNRNPEDPVPSPPPRISAYPNPADSVARAQDMLRALEPMELPPPAAPEAGTIADLLGQGDQALQSGRTEAAAGFFRKALELDKHHPDALAGLAMSLLMAEKYEESIPVYWNLIGIKPDAYSAYHNLALALIRTDQRMEAERVYLLLLDRKPDFIEGQANLATLYQARGKLADAARHWRTVTDLDATRADAWANLGEILIELGDNEASMEAYAEAAKLQPKNASAWLNYAAAAQAAGSGGRAIVALDRAIELAPEDAEAWRMLGDTKLEIYRARDDVPMLKEALDAWRKSLELESDQPTVRKLVDLYGPIAERSQ